VYSLQSGFESILCSLIGNDVTGALRFFGIFFGGWDSIASSSESDVSGLLSPDCLLSTFGSMRWTGGDGYGPGVELRRGENVVEAAGNGEDMDVDMDVDMKRESLLLCILGMEIGTGGNRVGSIDMVLGYKLAPCCMR
jgi:hypothetical protein